MPKPLPRMPPFSFVGREYKGRGHQNRISESYQDAARSLATRRRSGWSVARGFPLTLRSGPDPSIEGRLFQTDTTYDPGRPKAIFLPGEVVCWTKACSEGLRILVGVCIQEPLTNLLRPKPARVAPGAEVDTTEVEISGISYVGAKDINPHSHCCLPYTGSSRCRSKCVLYAIPDAIPDNATVLASNWRSAKCERLYKRARRGVERWCEVAVEPQPDPTRDSRAVMNPQLHGGYAKSYPQALWILGPGSLLRN